MTSEGREDARRQATVKEGVPCFVVLNKSSFLFSRPQPKLKTKKRDALVGCILGAVKAGRGGQRSKSGRRQR